MGDHNTVVASGHKLGDRAFEDGECAGENGGAGRAGLPTKIFKAIFRFAGEARGKFGLIFGQDVYSDIDVGSHVREQGGAFIEAEEDERRREGDRSEGVGGHAVGCAGRIHGGEDCYAGSPEGAGAAKPFRGELA